MIAPRTPRLREVAEINPKFAANGYGHDYDISFVPMANVSADGAVICEDTRKLGDVRKGFTPFQNADILVAKITPCFENNKIIFASIRRPLGFASTEFHVVRPDPEQLDGRFAFHFLRQERIRNEGRARMTGSAGQRRVPADFLEGIEIPLPPLPEQQRIAAILDKADALRQKRREAIAKLDTLLQSVFLEMFGDPVTNPRGWPIRPLQSLIDPARPITYGILMPGPHIPEGVRYVRVVDIRDGMVLVDAVRRTNETIAHTYRRSSLKPGDLLLTIRGHVGRLAIVPPELDGANITQDTARLAPTCECSVGFLQGCFETTGLQHLMEQLTRGVAVKGINLGDVKRLPIPVPPPMLQKQFETCSQVVTRLRRKQVQSQVSATNLFSSLQHRAFEVETRGEGNMADSRSAAASTSKARPPEGYAAES